MSFRFYRFLDKDRLIQLKMKVQKWTGIPIPIGKQTKTLTMANHKQKTQNQVIYF